MEIPSARQWTISRKLALLALALGAGALVGDPGPGGRVVIDAQELARIVESEADHVAVEELADWIIQNRSDYRLIDLRDEAAYAAYHIPTAERVSLRDLRDYPLYRNEKIVLYSDGGIHAAQAWFLLRAQGYAGSYTLLGGLDAWKHEILFPALPAHAGPEEAASFERLRSISQYFGGAPRTGSAEQLEEESAPIPRIESPPASGVVAPKTTRRHKEGC
jgi:rhodanese-related sulfurtransferase